MQQGHVKTQDGRFLTAVLGRTAGKDASQFAGKGTLRPESPGRIEKLAHLTAHVAEPRWRAENDGIGLGQLFHRTDRDRSHPLLSLQGAHFFQDFFGQGFRHTV